MHWTGSPTSALPPAAVPAGEAQYIDPCFLDFLHANVSGIIELGRSVEVSCLIAQAMAAFPNRTMAVVTASRDRTSKLRNQIREHGFAFNEQVLNCCGETVPRVVVGTFFDMGDEHVKFEKRDIVFVMEAQESLGQRAQIALGTIDARFRFYGFSRNQGSLSKYEQAWMLATFGPACIAIPRHGHEQVPVNVAWLRCDSPHVSPKLTGSETIAAGYSRHHVRNRLIASVAAAMVCGDDHRMPRVLPDGSLEEFHRPGRVAVLTGSLEHAINLAANLPNWPIIAGDGAQPDGLSRWHQSILRRRQLGWITGERLIVTSMGLHKIDISGLDVVIWAGGGSGLPPLDRRQLLKPAGSDHSLLIVDVADRHAPLLRQWTRERREKYLHANWFPPGISRTNGRVAVALANFMGAQQ